MTTITNNLERIRAELADAATAVGRNPDTVQLLAVSKTKPVDMVIEAMGANQQHFGENTIQDAQTKIPLLKERSPSWHFIGHLQTNKAKFIPGQFQWLHTLDNLGLARRLSGRLDKAGESLNTLIQVNITHDERKHGLMPDAVNAFMEQLQSEQLPSLKLRGLMTIGLQSKDSSELRKGFSDLRELRDRLAHDYDLPQFDQLSMGMSSDYREAIAEGSTWVRIGSAIFGSRE